MLTARASFHLRKRRYFSLLVSDSYSKLRKERMSLLFGLLHTLENSVRIKKKQRLHQIHIIRTRYNFKFTVTTRRFVATDRTFACPMFLWSKLESVLQCWAPPVNIFSRSSFSDNFFSFSIRHGNEGHSSLIFLSCFISSNLNSQICPGRYKALYDIFT